MRPRGAPRPKRRTSVRPKRRSVAAARVAAAALLACALGTVDAVVSAFTAKATSPNEFAAAAVFPPRLVQAPGITGTAREGETLTGVDATWARRVDATTRRWFRCGATCTQAGTGDEHVLTAQDVGQTLEYRVTASNPGGETTAASPRTAPVLPAPPASVSPPAIAGNLQVGDVLTATPGAWTGSPTKLAYRWIRCFAGTCASFAGGTEPEHLITGDDPGSTLKVEVTATNAGGSTTATSDPTAPIARASFTQILCRNPDDGTRVGADAALPDGLTFGRNVTEFPSPAAATRCATGGAGVPLSTGGTWSVGSPNLGGWLQYRGTTELQFAGATLYRHGQMSGNFSWAVDTSTTTAIFTGPRAELCSWGFGCTTRGTPTAPFADDNRVDIARGDVNGFNVVLLCDVPGGRTCSATGAEIVSVYGAKITLRDDASPRVTEPPTGGLAAPGPLAAAEDLDFKATDAGSGLYRLRVRIGSQEVATRLLHQNGGRCVDVNPGNGDPYEFAYRQPCAASLAAELDFDTTTWPKAGRLRVYLEDAGRNTTLVVNRPLP